MRKTHASLLFLVICFVVFLWMALKARTFQPQASYFPFYIASIACILSIVGMVKQAIAILKGDDEGLFHHNLSRVVRYIFWIVGFVVVIYIAGIIVASFIYLFLFLYNEAKMNLLKTVVSSGVAVTVIVLVSKFLELKWPSSLLGLF